MSDQHPYIYYGTRASSQEVEQMLLHMIAVNTQAAAHGRPQTPLCIWGQHGIGKTELVRQVARDHGYQWAYIAPAQFEEMGDLIGMPRIQAHTDGTEGTSFAPPEWVPRTPGPGILLIDDVNRADDRILRGIMQLLQNYALVSWQLPPQWHIVLTANPDGGDYSVTPMDFAMLTRMMHVTMVFDIKRWAAWAERSGVDPRGINFVLTYPEVITGERTTPRSLVQFFESIAGIPDLKAELALVKMLGDACLDAATVASFLSFIDQRMAKLLSPQEILEAEDFQAQIDAPVRKLVVGDTKRVDILAVLCTRLFNHISAQQIELQGRARDNVIAFLLMDFFPNDLRFMIAQDMMREKHPHNASIWAHPELGLRLSANLF